MASSDPRLVRWGGPACLLAATVALAAAGSAAGVLLPTIASFGAFMSGTLPEPEPFGLAALAVIAAGVFWQIPIVQAALLLTRRVHGPTRLAMRKETEEKPPRFRRRSGALLVGLPLIVFAAAFSAARAAILEELLFRFLPLFWWHLADAHAFWFYLPMVAANALFALIHLPNYARRDRRLLRVLPQFLGGFWEAYFFARYGLFGAVASHFLFNFAVLGTLVPRKLGEVWPERPPD